MLGIEESGRFEIDIEEGIRACLIVVLSCQFMEVFVIVVLSQCGGLFVVIGP